MPHHRLINGYLIPFEVARGEIPLAARESECKRAGRPRLSGEENATFSFKCPESSARMIACAARVSEMGRSAFIRDAAVKRAAAILSMQEVDEPRPA